MVDFTTISKSKQFYEFLKNEIIKGEYKSNDKFPSIRELAKKYNLSTVTINSVISKLVDKGYLYIEQGVGTFIVGELGNGPKSSKIIGVMFYDFRMENNIEATMFDSIQENLKDNYYLIPYNNYDSVDQFYKGLRGFSNLETDGLILIPPSCECYDSNHVRDLIPKSIPVVFINRNIPSVPADFLAMDFEAATYIAVRNLFEKGRDNILLITHCSPSINEKMVKGYVKAHKEFNMQFNSEYIFYGPKSSNGIDERFKNIFKSILEEKNYINGIIASDIIIYKYRRCIFEAKRNIPEDISITSINDSVYSRFMDPPLTSVPLPATVIGKKAAKIIIDRIEGEKYPIVEELLIGNIVERKS